MPESFTHHNLLDVDDQAPAFGLAESQEARFANDAMDTAQTGLSLHRIKPGARQGFGHSHDEAEEVYVVLAGTGRMKLDDEIIDLRERDAVRVAGPVIRAFEGGDDGLEVLAVGPRRPDDRGELIDGWW
ncbi:MAG: cupin domain-containing protein [Solirubrobacterales bacterium]